MKKLPFTDLRVINYKLAELKIMQDGKAMQIWNPEVVWEIERGNHQYNFMGGSYSFCHSFQDNRCQCFPWFQDPPPGIQYPDCHIKVNEKYKERCAY
jgi:hypothetical protein